MGTQQLETNLTGRQERMLSILEKEGFVPVDTFAGLFDVSEHTVRRDLEVMANAGVITRVRGGAVPTKETQPTEIPYAAQKRRIGKAAAELVRVGEILCIDAGSTTLEVGKNLPKSGISVLTNAVNIAYEIARQGTDIDITLTGGSVLPGKGGDHFGLSGPHTLKSLEQAGRVSKTIIGTLGIDFEYGITDRWHYLAAVKRKMIEIAETVVLVVDSSKFGKRYLEVVSGVDAVDIVVTDDGISPSDAKALEARGVRVITC